MKKGMLAFVLVLLVFASTASADGGYNVTLHWSYGNGNVTFGGQFTNDGVGVEAPEILIEEYDTPDCSYDTWYDEQAWYGFTASDSSGNYTLGPVSDSTLFDNGGSGRYFVRAWAWNGETLDWTAVSSCLPLNPGSSQVNHEFLCNSKWQVQPGVYSWTDAMALEQQGYWLPTAVDGNIDGGTNLGSYNLQCNVTPKGDGYVGASGEWWAGDWSAYAAAEGGMYPH